MFEADDRHRLFQKRLVCSEHRSIGKEPIGIACEVQNSSVWITLPQVTSELIASHVWHHDVQHVHIEWLLGVDDFQRIATARSAGDLVCGLFKRSSDKRSNRLLVIHDENSRSGRRRSGLLAHRDGQTIDHSAADE